MGRALCLLPASRSAASLTIDYNFCLILSKLPAPSQSGWEVFYFRRSNFPVNNKENFQKKGERGNVWNIVTKIISSIVANIYYQDLRIKTEERQIRPLNK